MPEGVADERGFRLLELMREDAGSGLSLADFKTMVRDQFFMLLLDERRAIEAMPAMLDADLELAQRMATTLRKLIEVVGVESKLGKSRVAEMTAYVRVEEGRKGSQEWCAEERVARNVLASGGRQRRSRIGPIRAI